MFLLLKASDEGAKVSLLFDADVFAMLMDPVGTYGIVEFQDFHWYMKNKNPAYWPPGYGVLIKFDGVTLPREVTTTHWVIDE